ncbi:rRNA-binding ribosome biosynthesis protein utp25 [Savitreella phatthalungensis]
MNDLADAAPMAYDALMALIKVPGSKRAVKRRRLEHDSEEQRSLPHMESTLGQTSAMHRTQLSEGAAEAEEEEVHADDPFELQFQPESAWLDSSMDAVGSQAFDEVILAGEKMRYVQRLPQNTVPRNFTSKHLKSRLRGKEHLTRLNVNKTILSNSLFSYADVCFTDAAHPSWPALRRIYTLHIANHVLKARDKVLKNNAKLRLAPTIELRDQGFTRPSVLVLLPTRHACLEVVNEFIARLGAEQVENRKRFEDSFGVEDDPLAGSNKPADFRAAFKGNTDDAFRVGLKVTRKTVKLFAQFYNSDVILASPLGLRMAIGDEATKNKKKRDFDFLSSINVVVVESADQMHMQNWQHVEHIFDHLNRIPLEQHGCDFGRVRQWALEGKSANLRQTFLLSQYDFPELRSLFAKGVNCAGSIRSAVQYDNGAIDRVGVSIAQTFVKVYGGQTPADEPDARFEFFKNAVLPRLKMTMSGAQDATLLFVPSYFDFTRVRNHIKEQEIECETLSEYSTTSETTRARHLVAQGRCKLLLITERLQHFRRFAYKGISHVLFYQLPEHQLLYIELLRDAARTQGSLPSSRSLFTRWDALRLERIAGSTRTIKMLRSDKSTSPDATATFEFA